MCMSIILVWGALSEQGCIASMSLTCPYTSLIYPYMPLEVLLWATSRGASRLCPEHVRDVPNKSLHVLIYAPNMSGMSLISPCMS